MVKFPVSEALAIIDQGGQISFSDLESRVSQRTKTLSGQNQKSELLILIAENTIEFVIEFLSGLRASKPIVICNQDWTESEKNLRLGMLKLNTLHADAALVIFTSGSTGLPKAVQLSQDNIRANTEAVIKALHFSGATEQTVFLPLSYSFGLLGQLIPALAVGMTTRLLKSFADVPRAIANHEIGEMWSGVPSHWQALVRIFNDPVACRHLTHVISAGAPLPYDLRRQLALKFPAALIYNNYGLTEMSPRVLSFSSQHPSFFDSGVGFPVQGIDVKLEPSGELCVKGPQMMLGYLGDEAATQDRIQEGWLHTGDFAEITDDGLINLLGRKDDLFKLAGERVSIHEIENALLQTKLFKEVAIFLEEDSLYGVKVNAFIVWAGKSEVNQKDLRAQVSHFISLMKVPGKFFVVGSLPKNENGKVARVKLKDLLPIATELT